MVHALRPISPGLAVYVASPRASRQKRRTPLPSRGAGYPAEFAGQHRTRPLAEACVLGVDWYANQVQVRHACPGPGS